MKDEKETLSLGLKIEMLYCIRRKNNNGDVCAYDADMLVVLIRRNFAQEEIY